jgi:putative heme-binding domain-containing protein
LSSIAGQERAFFDELLLVPPTVAPGAADLYSEFGRLLAASQPPTERATIVQQLLRSDPLFPGAAALLAGFGDTVRNQGAERRNGSVLAALVGDDDARLRACMQLAQEVAADIHPDPRQRTTAISLLAHSDFRTSGQALLALVDPVQPAAVQSGAIRALATMPDAEIAAELLSAERFPSYTPAMREEVLSAMLSGPQHLPGLLTAVEAGVIPPGAIDTIRRKQLTEHKDTALRDRARRTFGEVGQSDRGKVFAEHKPLLALRPDSENGRAVFKKHCANCHRLDREGYAVGPDLFGIRNQPKEAILLHILIPEQEITQGFLAYVAETKDGRVLTGLLASETPTSVTLKQALGKEETILRTDLDRLVSSKLSLMPQEFEKSVSKQELADLISYLKGEQAVAEKK